MGALTGPQVHNPTQPKSAPRRAGSDALGERDDRCEHTAIRSPRMASPPRKIAAQRGRHPTMTSYPEKITFGEMRSSGVSDVLIYCRDHRCSHSTTLSADGGRITSGCRTLSLISSARPAAIAARRSDRSSHRPRWARLKVPKSTRRPSGFVAPCQPSKVARPPSGPDWVHEIKHDGYRLMVRRDGPRVRCFTKNGHDWAEFHFILQLSGFPATAGPNCFRSRA